jgi:hypothetical protein
VFDFEAQRSGSARRTEDHRPKKSNTR